MAITVADECGGVHQWKSPKVYQLLLAIVALGGRYIPASEIGDLIWSDVDGDKAMQNLEFTLRRLRQILKERIGAQWQGDQTILVHYGKISLNPELIALDLWQWQAWSAKAKAHRDKQEHQEAMALERRAAELIQGPFLQGDDGLAGFHRERWHSCIGNWLHATIEAWHQDPAVGHETVIELMDWGLKIEPSSQRLCLQRVNVLLDAGYRVDALRTYRDWAERVHDTLKIDRPDLPDLVL